MFWKCLKNKKGLITFVIFRNMKGLNLSNGGKSGEKINLRQLVFGHKTFDTLKNVKMQ